MLTTDSQATTLEALPGLYERQFATKGRVRAPFGRKAAQWRDA